MARSISEILKRVSEEPNFDNRVALLQQNSNTTLQGMLRLAFDHTLKFLLPPGAPPYKENIYQNQHGNLYAEMKRMYLFLEGGNVNLTKVRRETLFIQLLEVLDKEDAKLMLAVKDKKLPYKNITRKLVETAFPGLLAPLEEKTA